MKLPKIQLDKLKHFFWGAIGLTTTCILWAIIAMVYPAPVWVCAIPIAFVAAWKELWHDWYKKKGNCELMDFVYTVSPCALLIF